MKKKVLAIVTAALIGTTAFAATASAASGTIDVISREDGSGTRGVLIFDMLAGRLEIFPLMLLFFKGTWKKF